MNMRRTWSEPHHHPGTDLSRGGHRRLIHAGRASSRHQTSDQQLTCYTPPMAIKSLEQKIDALTSIVEKGFAAVAEDIARIDTRMDALATKDQVLALQTQVNSIERQLRDTKMEVRLADLEDEVFGASKTRAGR
jgi:hypothetical protein